MLLMIDVETLGEKIRRLRDEQGLSLGKFAEKAGISKDGLWRIETGKTDSPCSLTKIAAALGMSVVELRSEVIRQDASGRVTRRDASGNTPAKPPAPESQPEGMRAIWVSADTYGQLEHLAAKRGETVEQYLTTFAKVNTTKVVIDRPDPAPEPKGSNPAAPAPKLPEKNPGRKRREHANH